ncbi:amino acid ABC transporter ATP-binding protein [Kitasatospora sp. NPDC094028]
MPDEHPTPTTTSAFSPVSLATRDLHLTLGGNPVLRGVDLDVPRGHTLCVIGPSGSGKSTLLRTINRLVEPDRGDILLDGESVLRRDPDLLRRQVGMVFQHFNLFPHMSILRNITLPLRKLKRLSPQEATETAHRQLDLVGLRHKADARPEQLSGGQQQRAAIARALAMAPQIMLFDEATSALDPELVNGVLALMADLGHAGMTMVVVTHEIGFAREAADTIAFMDNGIIVESGPPEALLDTPASPRLRTFLSNVL